MADKQWTPQQKNAIDAKSGTLLLSAAAGSGKTAVLVERIIRILTDDTNTTMPENLLVVTFTNAAAAEMRRRIAEAIDNLASKYPNEPKYGEIRMKLPDATISTMDSFCIKTVRENYHALDIEPDFKILDDSELRILQNEAMETVMNEISVNDGSLYAKLISLSGSTNNDTVLCEKVQKLYDISLSYPYPNKWLEGLVETFSTEKGTLMWKNTINTYTKDCLLTYREMLSSFADLIKDRPDLCEYFDEKISQSKNVTDNIISLIDTDKWDETITALQNPDYPKLSGGKKAIKDDPLMIYGKSVLKFIRDDAKNLQKYYTATDSENQQDRLILTDYINELILCVKKYAEKLDRIKKEKNEYCFSDFMHKSLKLFLTDNGERTPLAIKTAEQFDEILIDEYQDTNDAQDMLFESISREGKNLFTVGDVKQSIYSFRMARPELFVKKADSYPDFNNKAEKSKIILGTNFRSRKGVLEGINYMFEMIMSKKGGGIDYNENEKLNFGNTSFGNDTEPCIEMHITDGKSDVVADAKRIGGIIRKMIEEKHPVTDKNGIRPCRYGDFCILLRSLQGKSDTYAKVLNDMGIPTYAQKKAGLFDTSEINLVLSLIGAIDNPSNDVAVLSALYSPVFGFTPDEIAEIRIKSKKTKLYTAVKHSADEGNSHSAEFIEKIGYYRNLSAVLPLSEYISILLEDTSYPYTVNAMAHGDARKANLLMFISLASDYEEKGGNSVSGFIRYINKSIENNAQIPVAVDISENADVVRVFSIHKSKGLEFPFVIIADCGKKLNIMDLTDNLIINSETGIGMKITDTENLKKYDTLSLSAAKINTKKNIIAEEMRILYVAMTRAKEKLILTCTVENFADKIRKTLINSSVNGKINSVASMNISSYFDWFAMTYIKHPDACELRKLCDLTFVESVPSDFRMKFIITGDMEEETENKPETKCSSDSEIISLIKEKAEYVYPYEQASLVTSKRTASDFEKNKFSPDFFAKSKPAFLYDGKLTPAQIGTANHLFLQLCDFDDNNIELQIENLVKQNKITAQQGKAVKKDLILSFLQSDLCRRMKNADTLMREKKFAVFIPAEVFTPDLPDYAKNENVFVQGMTDAVFIEKGKAYIVDYKTDRTDNEEVFRLSYSKQLNIYKIAMESILHIPVEKCYIYSLFNEKTIEI